MHCEPKKLTKVNAKTNLKLYQKFYQAIKNNLIASSISLSHGGLAVALAKTAIGGKLGIKINLNNISHNIIRNDYILYSESQGRILVSINPKNKNKFENNFKNISFFLIGKVTEDQKFIINGLKNKNIINLKVDDLEKAYKSTFKNY